MSLSQDPKTCDCRGNARERHTVKVLYRGAGGTVTFDAVPADAAHEIVEAVAHVPWQGWERAEPVTFVRPAGYTARGVEPGGSQVAVPEAVIVVRPDQVQSVMLT